MPDLTSDLTELRRRHAALTPSALRFLSNGPGGEPFIALACEDGTPLPEPAFDAVLLFAELAAAELPALLDAAAERDALLAIIDDARHALSADGPKLEPARQVLARALPQTTAWQDRTRHARDNTPPHVIAHRGAQLDAVTAERDALAAMLSGRCLSDITHRDDEHRQSVCMLPEGHAPLMHDDCMGCTWTDAEHWEPSAVDRVADEVARIADESQHDDWDSPRVRSIVGRIRRALDGEARP